MSFQLEEIGRGLGQSRGKQRSSTSMGLISESRFRWLTKTIQMGGKTDYSDLCACTGKHSETQRLFKRKRTWY